MKTLSLNHETLSAYLDGELDTPLMRKIENELEQDSESRHFLYDTLHMTVRLKADGRKMLDTPVPATLEQAILPTPGEKESEHTVLRWFQPLQMAVAASVLVLCIGLGIFLLNSNSSTPSYFFPTLPDGFVQAVSQSLESNLSGDTFVVNLGGGDERVLVTPTKTYKDKSGQYFRDFQMEIIYNGTQQQVTGLAVRKGEKDWVPTAIYYPKG